MGQSRVLACPKNIVGRIIGKGGETIKTLQKQFSVSIQIDQNTVPCKVTIAGQQSAIQAAERAITDIIEDRPHAGGGGGGGGGFHGGECMLWTLLEVLVARLMHYFASWSCVCYGPG